MVDLVVGAAVALVLAGLCDTRPIALARFLGSRPLRRLGSFSYSMYLVHLPLLTLLSYYVLDSTSLDGVSLFAVMLATGVPTVLVGSWLFYLVFERPFVENRSLPELRRAVTGSGRGGEERRPVVVEVVRPGQS